MLGKVVVPSPKQISSSAELLQRALLAKGRPFKHQADNALSHRRHPNKRVQAGALPVEMPTGSPGPPRGPNCPLTAVYGLAQEYFGSRRTPTQEELDHLLQALADVPMEILNLRQPPVSLRGGSQMQDLDAVFPKRRVEQKLHYQSIADNEDFVIGIFLMGPGTFIPLHNHPGMTVLSRVIYGELAVRSYDWDTSDGSPPRHAAAKLETSSDDDSESVEGVASSDSRSASVAGSTGRPASLRGRRATLVMDGILSGGNRPTILEPARGGNIHTFNALTDCAVLDLLAPPYKPQEERDCTYYKEIEKAENVGDFGVLQEVNQHDIEDYVGPTAMHYRGVKVERRWLR